MVTSAGAIKNCTKCKSLNSCKSLSWGNHLATTIFIGQNPSQTIKEDRLCFQSKAFTEFFIILKELNLKSDKFFYTNMIRCATPENRAPTKEERNNCSEYLFKELEFIKPYNIICLGKEVGDLFNLKKLYSSETIHYPIEAMVHLFPHPSYITRFPNKREDFKVNLKRVLNG